MACYHPIRAWYGRTRSESGKRPLVFNARDAVHTGASVLIPCGQCIGCRLEKSRQWAMRCMHEASLYDENCFITLTYDEEHLPEDGSLRKEDFQLFMKRLRKHFKERDIRFYHCGEYGTQCGRPHYHALIFGFDFYDKFPIQDSKTGLPQWSSFTLSRLWGKGFVTIGRLTWESAAYCARYVVDKITNKEDYVDAKGDFHFGANAWYGGRLPEYATMSRRPGIGRPWLDKFFKDVYPDDCVFLRGGIEMRPPAYYQNVLSKKDAELFNEIKRRRVARIEFEMPAVARLSGATPFTRDNTPDRLEVKEKIKKRQIQSFNRSVTER